MKKITINLEDDNKKLVTYLTNKFPTLSINSIYKALRKKNIKINGKRIKENITLHYKDIIEIFICDDILYKVPNISIPIIYEDNNIIVFNKPQAIEVNQINDKNSITYIMKDKFPFLKPCHRIDRNTTGLVLFAKNMESLEILLEKFKNGEIEKHYLACIYGNMIKKEDCLNSFLFKDRKKSLVYISDTLKKGYVPIKTSYKVIKENKNTKVSLLDITLHTGKTHQIRAQLAHIGFPIIGDGKYGSYKINKDFKTYFQLLCSYSITFSFKNDSGILNYLNGLTISLKNLPFTNYIGEK